MSRTLKKHNSGEGNHLAKLTEEQVREIRRLRPKDGPRRRFPANHPLSLRNLAKRFGIKPSQVSKICLGTGWRHLP